MNWEFQSEPFIEKLKSITLNSFMFTKKTSYFFLTLAVLTLGGCGIYSFSGASIPAEAKTVYIGYFENKAELVEATLSQTLTDDLKNRFSSQTPLNITTQGGDLQIEGFITEYSTAPVAIQEDQAALNRLTITVDVTFVNVFDPSKDFENSKFTRYEDYPSSESLNSVQEALISVIVEALVEDIFNATVVNW